MRTTHHPFRSLVAIGAACTLALTACGGDDDEPASEPAAEPAEEPAAEPATEPAEEPAAEPVEAPAAEPADGQATITIADFAFAGVTEVAVGTTVIVTNDDSTTHTWTAVDGAFDSGALAPGDSFEVTLTEAGSFDYQCNFHPSMTGTIVVTG